MVARGTLLHGAVSYTDKNTSFPRLSNYHYLCPKKNRSTPRANVKTKVAEATCSCWELWFPSAFVAGRVAEQIVEPGKAKKRRMDVIVVEQNY